MSDGPRTDGAPAPPKGGPGAPGPPRRAPDRDDEVVEAELVDDDDEVTTEPEELDDVFGSGAPPLLDDDVAVPGAPGAPATPGGSGPSGSSRPAPGSDAAVDEAAASVEVDLGLLLSEREQFLGASQRIQADFENYRRQAQKRQDDAVVRELGKLVEGLLPVLDACDAAVAHGTGAAVEPIVAALHGALEKEGLERIDPADGPFDPSEAEAVMHEPGGGGEQVVAEVMRAGYRWRGRVLRPAMVKVTD